MYKVTILVNFWWWSDYFGKLLGNSK